ncbi:hypothetical protein CYMTET_7259 [Cymbomonas tetramitiformis]|uniref:Uncharacterized protein n=1 Tax=Cymbomonas tetramitiformis TaxID=36881 RepID=A0AAE0GXB5_9CHLO|nr:hypothetical protein CYMTET_7259 [Cymbomonas tetramitiformis]
MREEASNTVEPLSTEDLVDSQPLSKTYPANTAAQVVNDSEEEASNSVEEAPASVMEVQDEVQDEVLSTPESRAADAQRWIDDWRVEGMYREFYVAVGTVRIKRAKDSKVFKFGDFLAMQEDASAKEKLLDKL